MSLNQIILNFISNSTKTKAPSGKRLLFGGMVNMYNKEEALNQRKIPSDYPIQKKIESSNYLEITSQLEKQDLEAPLSKLLQPNTNKLFFSPFPKRITAQDRGLKQLLYDEKRAQLLVPDAKSSQLIMKTLLPYMKKFQSRIKKPTVITKCLPVNPTTLPESN
jgi:hypothetical protein